MKFGKWITKKLENAKGQILALPNDIIEIHGKTYDKKQYICKGDRISGYFWANKYDFEFCVDLNDKFDNYVCNKTQKAYEPTLKEIAKIDPYEYAEYVKKEKKVTIEKTNYITASSDCIKCCDTPCTCGYEYRGWSIEKLEDYLDMLQTVLNDKKTIFESR